MNASMLHAQLGSGGDYDALVPVYVICLMDFSLWHSQDRLIYRYSLIEEDLHDRYRQTIVIVTHDPSLAALCDRTLQMRDGQFLPE